MRYLLLCLALACCGCPYDPNIPPGPGPEPVNPVVPVVAPGLRVLIVYESAELNRLPSAQRAALTAASVRKYLTEKCGKGRLGTPNYRVFDDDANLTGEDQLFKDMLAEPRASMPWIIVKNDKAGFSGPLPANTADLLALLKKYGG